MQLYIALTMASLTCFRFDRVEILSGFINALFLVVISFFVLTAGLGRLFEPPEIHTERLLVSR